ncbi:liver carboxylesterase 2-like isoform X2 [Thrips palmi]|uniref:Liver carboxylesterase 2-like isoform X2 n=1 Tax=Thrips palmi TaxID=161013 RepID=A0A6P8YGD4_THRPL|nr:liver carboxylesterase 2-like isoform X2 [Thrips palmi]
MAPSVLAKAFFRMGASQSCRSYAAAVAKGLEVAMPWGGKVRGRVVEPTNSAPPYQAFLGIPYAKPPTGKLRFMPPQPVEGWTGVRDAVQEPDLCLQVDYNSKKLVGSEDCLYLNVYRPPGTQPNAKKPVMVYIHYGMWTLSNSSLNEVGPEFFVAKDIVVVVIQYRLTAFGFLSLASPTVPGNMGIKDCMLGLRWVHDNITAFGGDPAQVTVSGFCVGGQIANLMQYQDECKGLFHRNISLSGAIGNSWFGFVPADVMRARSLKLARLLGCHSTNDEEVLAFLQAAPADQLFAKAWDVVDEPAADRPNPPFMPVIDAVAGRGNAVAPEHPIALMRKHRQHAVPTLFGVAREEGHVFRDFTKFWAGTYTEEKDLPERGPKADRMLPWDLDLPLGSPEREAVAKEIQQLYFGNAKTPTLYQFYEWMSDATIMGGMIESARHHATHPAKPDTYLYCFAVEAAFNRGRVRHNILPGVVVHTDDLGYFFGCGATAPGPEKPVAPDSIEAVTRRRLVGLMANFVKTGDPTPAGVADPDLGDVRWPRLPATLGAPYPYLEIGNDLTVKYELYGARMRFWQTLYDRYFTTGDTPQARKPVTFQD